MCVLVTGIGPPYLGESVEVILWEIRSTTSDLKIKMTVMALPRIDM